MLGFINSAQFRKHPNGGKGLVNLLRILFLIGSIIGFLLVVISMFAMFKNEVSLYVISKKSLMPDIVGDGFMINKVKQLGILNFKTNNVLEWLLLPRSNRFDLFSNLFSSLITWQLFKIASEINMDKPFFTNVLKRLDFMHQLIMSAWVVSAIQYSYVIYVINTLTNKSFSISSYAYLISPGYFSLGTWLIVFLFTYVYRKGIRLQQDQDLTI